MKIKLLTIKNFRSFLDFTLPLEGKSLFIVGECAVGKTTLLTAIARGLGKDYRAFAKADFGDLNEAIEVCLTLSDLNPAEAAVFCERADFKDGTVHVGVRVTWDTDDEVGVAEHGYPHRDWQKSSREERDALPLLWLPADRDVVRMLQFGSRRNLISRLIGALSLEKNIEKAILDAQEACAQLSKSPEILDLLIKSRRVLCGLLPGISDEIFDLIVAASTDAEVLRQLELGVSHEGPRIALGNQSSGLVQLIGFAFVVRALQAEPGTILLVDQPENSLHPQPQRALTRALRALDSQAIITTHSSNVLDRVDPRTILRLRRTDNGIQCSQPSKVSDAQVRNLTRYTTAQTAEAFFAKAVILVEGVSDSFALTALARRMSRDLDSEGITIVDMEGAGGLETFLKLFGPAGFHLSLAGLCDADKEAEWAEVLTQAGICAGTSRPQLEEAGFYVCTDDLEQELVQALAVAEAIKLLEQEGDKRSFELFCGQPSQKSKSIEQKLHDFFAKGRKVRYAPLMVEKIDMPKMPAPLKGVLSSV